MSTLNFPTNPSLNDIYTQNNITFMWNGFAWISQHDKIFATLSGTETLTNKTYSGGALSGTIGGDATLSGTITLSSTGAIVLPTGTIAQRPNPPVTGMFRFNIELGIFEGYNGTEWVNLQAATPSEDFTFEGDLNTLSGTVDLQQGSGTVDLLGTSDEDFTFSGDLRTLSGTEDLTQGSGVVDLLL